MSRFHSYINTASVMLEKYKGEIPFNIFSRQFFADKKKYGSKDRKQIIHCCYCFFRTGHLLTGINPDKKIAAAVFLCSTAANELLENIVPEWNSEVETPLQEKISLTGIQSSGEKIFPWQDELSEGIDENLFSSSFLQQPDLFLRIRPGKKEIVERKLNEANICYKNTGDFSLVLSNGTKIETVIEVDKEAVVQDLSSQRTIGTVFNFIDLEKINCWDCCVASGGKSLLLYDLFKNKIELTVSDIRPSVLSELKIRFANAGIKNYRSFVADLSAPLNAPELFNLIVCDAPCSGSGTWSRTPEQLYFFKRKKINQFALLQQKIVCHAIPHLEQGGYFLYITCSVFKKENEAIVDFIKERFQLSLIKMELLKGYHDKADTMFVALFKKD
ncbi:MAG: Fmu (Sun) domain-containing protein [Ferruginibacter sp.]